MIDRWSQRRLDFEGLPRIFLIVIDSWISLSRSRMVTVYRFEYRLVMDLLSGWITFPILYLLLAVNDVVIMSARLCCLMFSTACCKAFLRYAGVYGGVTNLSSITVALVSCFAIIIVLEMFNSNENNIRAV